MDKIREICAPRTAHRVILSCPAYNRKTRLARLGRALTRGDDPVVLGRHIVHRVRARMEKDPQLIRRTEPAQRH